MKFSLFQFWAILIIINLLCLIASAQSMNESIDERIPDTLNGSFSGSLPFKRILISMANTQGSICPQNVTSLESSHEVTVLRIFNSSRTQIGNNGQRVRIKSAKLNGRNLKVGVQQIMNGDRITNLISLTEGAVSKDKRAQTSLTGISSGVSCSWQYGGAINKRDIRKKKITLSIFKDFYCSKDAGSEVLCHSEEFNGSLKRK